MPDLSDFKRARPALPATQYLPSSCWALNLIASGGMGFPRRQIIEFFGPEGSGKTTLVWDLCSIAANCLQIPVVYMVQDTAPDERRLAKFHLFDGRNILIEHGTSVEEAMEILQADVDGLLLKYGKETPIICVVDPISTVAPNAHVKERKYLDNPQPGAHAKSWSDMLRLFISKNFFSDITLLLINHITEKIGVTFGNPETAPGGRLMKAADAIRLEVRRAEAIKNDQGVVIGHITTVKTVKNKFAPPMQKIKIPLLYGNPDVVEGDAFGLWDAMACLWFLKECGVVKTAGGWSSIEVVDENGEVQARKFQGEGGWVYTVYPQYRNQIYQLMREVAFDPSRFLPTKPKAKK